MFQRLLVILSLWVAMLTAGLYASMVVTCPTDISERSCDSITLSDNCNGTLMATTATSIATPSAKPTYLPFSHRTYHPSTCNSLRQTLAASSMKECQPTTSRVISASRPVDIHIYRLRRIII
ncbi:MAG: hypothetical protein MJZ15_00870 [Bacteroidales bacterium]|nr:hypothetical protein [Bacteroidales bacterium]